MSLGSISLYFVSMAVFFAFGHWVSRKSEFFRNHINSVSKQRHAGLEGLRGILSLSVFTCHIVITHTFVQTGVWVQPQSYFYQQMGSVPVRIFFMLSGYLFWRKLMLSDSFSPVSFYWQRFRRIMPLYYFSFALIFFISMLGKFQFNSVIHDVLVPTFNWLVLSLPVGDFPPILGNPNTRFINAYVTWTLRWEWFLYLVLPFLTWFARGSRIFLYLIAMVATNYLLKKFVTIGLQSLSPIHLLITLTHRLAEDFGLGMLAAYLFTRFAAKKFFGNSAFGVIAAISAVLLFCVPRGISSRVADHTCAVLAWFVFLFVLSGHRWVSFLSHRSALLLGRVSYSVYLLHGIILYCVTQTFFHYGLLPNEPLSYWFFCIGVGILVLVCSMITFRFLEYPVLSDKAATRPILSPTNLAA